MGKIVVKQVDGVAHVIRDGKEIPLSGNMLIKNGDQIVTSENGKVHLIKDFGGVQSHSILGESSTALAQIEGSSADMMLVDGFWQMNDDSIAMRASSEGGIFDGLGGLAGAGAGVLGVAAVGSSSGNDSRSGLASGNGSGTIGDPSEVQDGGASGGELSFISGPFENRTGEPFPIDESQFGGDPNGGSQFEDLSQIIGPDTPNNGIGGEQPIPAFPEELSEEMSQIPGSDGTPNLPGQPQPGQESDLFAGAGAFEVPEGFSPGAESPIPMDMSMPPSIGSGSNPFGSDPSFGSESAPNFVI